MGDEARCAGCRGIGCDVVVLRGPTKFGPGTGDAESWWGTRLPAGFAVRARRRGKTIRRQAAPSESPSGPSARPTRRRRFRPGRCTSSSRSTSSARRCSPTAQPVASTAISSGTPGHPTPMGVFTVIQKDRHHVSNLYNAPMPYMQRITWSGSALHEGPLPGYPASHGCVRLTTSFAQLLWKTTKMGARVIVTRPDVAPLEIRSRPPVRARPKMAEAPRHPPAGTRNRSTTAPSGSSTASAAAAPRRRSPPEPTPGASAPRHATDGTSRRADRPIEAPRSPAATSPLRHRSSSTSAPRPCPRPSCRRPTAGRSRCSPASRNASSTSARAGSRCSRRRSASSIPSSRSAPTSTPPWA